MKPTIVMVALLAAVIVVAVGAGFYLLNGSKSAWNPCDASVATFVGNKTCAGVAGRKLNSCASSFCGVAMVLFAISLSTPGALSLRRAMVRSSLPPTATSRPMAPFCRSPSQ